MCKSKIYLQGLFCQEGILLRQVIVSLMKASPVCMKISVSRTIKVKEIKTANVAAYHLEMITLMWHEHDGFCCVRT